MSLDFRIDNQGEDYGTLVVSAGSKDEDIGIDFSEGGLEIRIPLYVGQAKELVEVVGVVAALEEQS